jgi:hypothetical protein
MWSEVDGSPVYPYVMECDGKRLILDERYPDCAAARAAIVT